MNSNKKPEYMGKIKLLLLKIAKWEYTPLCLLVLIVLILHLNTIVQPKDLVFDESYYIPAARSIIQGTGTNIIEHPPLSQLLIASGILLFGDSPLGWRFFSLIFGIFSIILFFLTCRQLKISKNTSFLATVLLSIENLSFVLAGIAMLDVYSLTFMLAAFWCYLKGWHVKAGLLIGLAALAKLSGALALLVILLHWLFTSRDNKGKVFIIILVSMASFLILMPLLDFAIWHRLLNPITQMSVMLTCAKSGTFAHYTQSPFGTLPTRPWEWLIHLNSIQLLEYSGMKHEWYIIYHLMISPSIWVLIIPSVLFMAYKAIKRSSIAIFVICWFAGTYLFWIPVSLITDRISYIYYFYPTIGAICIGIALGITRICNVNLKYGNLNKILSLITPMYLLVSLIVFMVLCPGNILLKVTCSIVIYAITRYYLEAKDGPSLNSDRISSKTRDKITFVSTDKHGNKNSNGSDMSPNSRKDLDRGRKP